MMQSGAESFDDYVENGRLADIWEQTELAYERFAECPTQPNQTPESMKALTLSGTWNGRM